MRARAYRPKPIPEKQVQRQIVNLLRSMGAAVYVIGTTRPRGDMPGTRQTPGIPDLYAVLPRRGHGEAQDLWIEVKRRGGKLRPEQERFQQQCREAGIPHVVGGVDDVIRYLVGGGWLSSSSVPHYRLPDSQQETRDVQ